MINSFHKPHCVRFLRKLFLQKRRCSTAHGDKKKPFFITTPIFYVNASPHLGHVYTAVIADAVQRFQTLLEERDVLFSTGTDEHGLKIAQAAEAAGCTPQIFCDKISQDFKKVFDRCSVSYTNYIRTTEERHKRTVEHFFNVLNDKGYLYKANYEGWYCTADETFLTDLQVQDKVLETGETVKHSIESDNRVEWHSEVNYMFKLSTFKEELLRWLEDENVVKPAKFHKDLVLHIERRLSDLSVSRPSSRVPWGIPVPWDNTHTIYVWLDALLNYLTVSGFSLQTSSSKMCWPPDVQVIGKDILTFHGVYWPAFLMALGYEPPKQLLVHCHWQVDGVKMSKSKGNFVDPHDLVDKFTEDGFRYVLLRNSAMHSDSSWSNQTAERFVNAEIADNLGNLLSRASAKRLNPSGEIPKLCPHYMNSAPDSCKVLIEAIEGLPKTVESHFQSYNFHFAVDAVMAVLRAANLYFTESQPWKLKDDPDRSSLDSILHISLAAINAAGICLQPIMPSLCERLFTVMGIPRERRFLSNISLKEFSSNTGSKLRVTKILFEKVD